MEMLIPLHNAVPKAVGAFCQEFWLKDGNEVKIQQSFSTNKSKHRLCLFSKLMVRGLGMKLFPALLQHLYLTICFCRNRKPQKNFPMRKYKESSSVPIKTFGFIFIN